MWRMNSFVSLLMFAILLLAVKPIPVNPMPVQTDSSISNTNATTAPNPRQHFSLTRYSAMVHQLVEAVQTIWLLLRQHGDLAPFEYCFLQNIANPPSTNLTIEDRLLIDYQVLNKLTTPLRDVVNYEGHISNDSDIYSRLVWARGQINTTLEDMTNIQSSDQLVEQLLPSEDHQSYQNSEYNTNDTLTTNNTTEQSQNRCTDVIMNSTDEFRDLFEIYLGLNFAIMDLLDIQHELDPHFPHEDSS